MRGVAWVRTAGMVGDTQSGQQHVSNRFPRPGLSKGCVRIAARPRVTPKDQTYPWRSKGTDGGSNRTLDVPFALWALMSVSMHLYTRCKGLRSALVMQLAEP